MSGLRGRVVLVTGSSRGIGAAIARLFAEEGAKVAVRGRDVAALSAVRAQIERTGGQALQVVADLTQFAAIEAMSREIEDGLGPVDLLVANAGAALRGPAPSRRRARHGTAYQRRLEGPLSCRGLGQPLRF